MAPTSTVLARKYRPQVFDDLLGQEALVQTISNGIKQNKLAQAYLLTGIRGIGKTTSARIIAKGLNCIGPDGKGGMTPNPCGKCRHCLDITNDADIDVIEIDAASNTGVENVREIIEGAKYNPVSARFKIYIIDEVHMLSKAAFNALLKTLEEPPERVKFIFATTEIRKVPVTIVSRCQRFDLKRIEEKPLAEYLQKIAKKEGRDLPEEAALILSHASEGSVRDSLSLLDQALVQIPADITADGIRQMLGLADKTILFDLYSSLLDGNTQEAFNAINKQYEIGAEPVQILQDLLNLVYDLTCLKAFAGKYENAGWTKDESKKMKQLAEQSSMATLTAFWQMMTKGLEEVKLSGYPLHALQMLMIRISYSAQILDNPENLIKQAQNSAPMTLSSTAPAVQTITSVEVTQIPKEPPFKNLAELANLARQKGQRMLAFNIEHMMHLIAIEDKLLRFSPTDNAPKTLSAELTKFLEQATGEKWVLDIQKSGGAPTEQERKEQKTAAVLENLKKQEDVSSILKQFPGAKIDKVKPIQTTQNEELEE